ncbi:MAG: HAMP domain-containing sensor histidine kinase [Desulfobacterales bacterium]|jgi:signal transduction histidine kinase
MKKLKLLILIFSLALCIPLAFFVLKTYRGLEQEEAATLRYFAETLFDEMEQALAVLVQTEEGRAIDEFNFQVSPSGGRRGVEEPQRSPLSQIPRENYIRGYFQNNPDGSFQTPLVETGGQIPPEHAELILELKDANEIFNRKRVTVTDRVKSKQTEMRVEKEDKKETGLADRYLDLSRDQRSKKYLGQTEKRLEKITVGQAANIAKPASPQVMRSSVPFADKPENQKDVSSMSEGRVEDKTLSFRKRQFEESFAAQSADTGQPAEEVDTDDAAGFQVEVAPLRAVFLNDGQIFIFRRIMIERQIYRQGFLLGVDAFLDYLTRTYFLTQPLSQFTALRLSVVDQDREAKVVQAGEISQNPDFILNRGFPSPFSFLKASLTCDRIPRSDGRRTLSIMLIVLAMIVLMGLFAIYRSVQTIVELSERRSQFVSSVTHELKTPLTNIRMYIEMLEQGIAANPEREQEYFRILDSEGVRLSRLINNVLEMSKLEKSQRHINLQTGTFEEVIAETEAVMAETLKQEGFTLNVRPGRLRPFQYDREVMIQVLINLIENSIKFGKSASKREIVIRTLQNSEGVKIMVSDTGPGIPRDALKKVFQDFYRVDNSLTRTTRGTGIGLALVKKFIHLMGGTVTASDNDGPGCTITIHLPA